MWQQLIAPRVEGHAIREGGGSRMHSYNTWIAGIRAMMRGVVRGTWVDVGDCCYKTQ